MFFSQFYSAGMACAWCEVSRARSGGQRAGSEEERDEQAMQSAKDSETRDDGDSPLLAMH